MERIEFTSSKEKQTFPLIMTACFAITGTLMIIFTDLYFLGAALAFGGGYGFYAIRKTGLSPDSILRIDNYGVKVSTTELEIELPWNEVIQCKRFKIVEQEHIFIYVKEPKEKLRKLNLSSVREKLYLQNIKTYDTFIFFSTVLLDMDTIEILKLMEKYRKTANKIN